MNIQYCSDLHLEFPLNEQYMKKYPLQAKGDILLLAGDITLFSMMDRHEWFFDFVSAHFKYTYWIPGNHEYYHADISQRSGTIHEKIRHNVFLVNNIAIEHEGVKLIFSTMWSKIDPAHEFQVARAMSDFQVIKYFGYRFTPALFNELHESCMAFLKEAIKEPTSLEKVVVTHHIPTLMNYPKKYLNDIVSQAFAIELFDLIEPSDIHSWIFGHHHYNIPDFMIGNTTMATNQLGYVKHGEHTGFMNDKYFKL